MEALRAAREGGGGAAKRVAEFEVKEEGALYDVVTEQDYADIAAKRRAEGGTHMRVSLPWISLLASLATRSACMILLEPPA